MPSLRPTIPNTPFIRSRVNGIAIPVLPGQAGILHRFHQPENQLVVAQVQERSAQAAPPDTASDLVMEGTPEPGAAAGLDTSPIPQSDDMAEQREREAALADENAALKARLAALEAAAPAAPAAEAPTPSVRTRARDKAAAAPAPAQPAPETPVPAFTPPALPAGV